MTALELQEILTDLFWICFAFGLAGGFLGQVFFDALDSVFEAMSQRSRRIAEARVRAKVEAWKAERANDGSGMGRAASETQAADIGSAH